jgi:hypothetical protein
MPAVAVVSDAFITFDSDEALNGFATGILQSRWPGSTLDPKAHIEGAMGFHGSEAEARVLLETLLKRAATAAGLGRAHYDAVFISARSQMPPAKVWCLVAVRH